MFLSSQNDLGTSSEERNPSATTSSTKDKDLDTDGSKAASTDGLVGAEPSTQSIIGPNGLR